ncbi:MAG: MogA/MoaB family molybdenum cofactor biosynthesis protein [Cyanobacteria bacterium NC_groundwater_1444_Ag_S-0.65um_54_12]|nr:MogA/MoaB family molybdenum cofactor biosynthesis protein [Cyanobacteria bacterium NC_groundwater_1444_Ag_S-0.65um_54_12]
MSAQAFSIGILTLSDTGAAGQRIDRSREEIVNLLDKLLADGKCEGQVAQRAILPDDRERIAKQLCTWSDDVGLDLIITTGGTGLGPRDVTPEATRDVSDYLVPGMAEAMRQVGLAQTPMAMLSRAVVGVRGRTLIVNLPGSPKGARESLAALLPALPHALEILRGRGGEDRAHGQL